MLLSRLPVHAVRTVRSGFRMTKVRQAWDSAVTAAEEDRVRAAAAAHDAHVAVLCTKLCTAVEAGDVGAARELMSQGASPCSACGAAGDTALHYATRGRQLEALELLLASGSDLFTPSSTSGETALHMACRIGTTSVRVVVAPTCACGGGGGGGGGVKVASPACVGAITCLLLLAGWVEGVQLMLKREASLICVPSKAGSRSTPMHVAVSRGHVQVLRKVVELAKEADVELPLSITNSHGLTPIDLAKSLEVLRLLKPRTDLGCAATVR